MRKSKPVNAGFLWAKEWGMEWSTVTNKLVSVEDVLDGDVTHKQYVGKLSINRANRVTQSVLKSESYPDGWHATWTAGTPIRRAGIRCRIGS